jgi:hypothetical protein
LEILVDVFYRLVESKYKEKIPNIWQELSSTFEQFKLIIKGHINNNDVIPWRANRCKLIELRKIFIQQVNIRDVVDKQPKNHSSNSQG